jgi:hypothetical protein
MAIVCPQCSEIHFETPGTAAVTHCRKCGSDVNGVIGLAPLVAADAAANGATKLRSREGLVRVYIGLVLLTTAGGLGWWGLTQYNGAKAATAVVIPAGSGSADGKGPTKDQIRHPHTAVYTVGGKKYFQYPGVRQLNDTFEVYYQPGNPAQANEERPWLILGVSGVLFKIGLITLLLGLFKFSVARAREADRNKVMSYA